MRYLTDDNQIFDTAEEAQDHEATLQAVKAQEAAIKAFLDETAPDDEGDRSRTRRRHLVQAWIAWSAKREAGDRVVRAIA